jgi:fructokinase
MQFDRTNQQRRGRTKPTIVGTGLVALDIIFRDDREAVETALGGSTGNVLAILSHLKWRALPVAQLGSDAAAVHIALEFDRLGADTRFLLQSKDLTTPVVYQFPGTGSHSHEFSFRCPVCGRKRGFVSPDESAKFASILELIDAPDVFYFDRVTPWALLLADRFRKAGSLVVFEPSTIGSNRDDFERAIGLSHIVKYADDRIVDMLGFDLSGVQIEIQTLGKKGLQFRLTEQSDRWHHLDAVPVPYVADTAGAGDWCTSGFLYALIGSIIEGGGRGQLSTRRIRESLRFGQTLAAMNCMEKGARGLARRYSAEHVVTLAAAIRSSMNPIISGSSGQAGHCATRPKERAPEAQRSISSLLCCEALAG